MRTAKTLIRLCGCPGWSESSLGAPAILLVCHVLTHILVPDESVSKLRRPRSREQRTSYKSNINLPTKWWKISVHWNKLLYQNWFNPLKTRDSPKRVTCRQCRPRLVWSGSPLFANSQILFSLGISIEYSLTYLKAASLLRFVFVCRWILTV